MSTNGNADLPVRVAVRCRPLIMKEISEGCQTCVEFLPGQPQVILGKDKAFTYDFAFGPTDSQHQLFDEAVFGLVDGIFKGYNATVLAYGQTGSGKTYSMGSGYDLTDLDKMGVIPRVVRALFKGINERSSLADFVLKCSFLELHNDDILDLLGESREPLAVREGTSGEIRIAGLSEVPVLNGPDMIALLEKGSTSRTVASTAMNSTSSRSHAVFTIHIDVTSKDDTVASCQAKFHLVDLAGSERAKRTKAKGERLKEGININKGLLALGNVISALGDDAGRKAHVPYRDSKLTRLLQDSLGGNSQTVMIACISPADTNMEETLNTLRYADRARKIKNKPIVNRDPQAAELARLRQQVQQLQYQLTTSDGSLPPPPVHSLGIVKQDNGGMKKIMERNKKLEHENQKLSVELQASLDQTTQMCEKAILAEMRKDKLKQKLVELQAKTDLSISMFNTSVDVRADGDASEPLSVLHDLKKQIEEMKSEPLDDSCEDLYGEMQAQDGETTTAELGVVGPALAGSPQEGEGTTTNNLTTQTLHQAQLGRELQELNRALALKQELAMKMGQSDEKMEVMKVQYETNIQGLEEQINSLQQEKDTLSVALQTNKSKTATSKISEQRRKRLKELEDEMGKLRKKVQEQSKLLRLKARSDETVTKLNKEIQSMKQARVRLMRQMKEDAERTRQWKMAKDREVLQLKAKDRKRQCDVKKMERKFDKQQNVLRRKMEEASAANKRLKGALDRHKAHSKMSRPGPTVPGHHLEGTAKRVKTLLERELDVLVGVNEAKRHLASLLEDRKAISREVASIKEQETLEPPSKKRATPDKSAASVDPGAQRRLQALQQELDVRNIEIQDIQQKLMDANQDEENRKVWKNINSMAEAKCGLRWLMEMAVLARVEAGKLTSDLADQKHALSELQKEFDDLQMTYEETLKEGDDRATDLQRAHEEKILYLLHQLSQSSIAEEDSATKSEVTPADEAATRDQQEGELAARLRFQTEQIRQLQGIHDQLQEVKEENTELKKKLTISTVQGVRMSLLPSVTSPERGDQPTTTKGKPKLKKPQKYYTLDELIPDSGSDSEAENPLDKTWVQTPQQRKQAKAARKGRRSNKLTHPADKAVTCGCGTNCSTRRCNCRKYNATCGDACGCLESACLNRQGNTLALESTNDETTGDSSGVDTAENGEVANDSSNTLNRTLVLESHQDDSPGLKDFQTVPKPRGILTESHMNHAGIKGKKKDVSFSSNVGAPNLSNQAVKRKRKLMSTSQTSFFKSLN